MIQLYTWGTPNGKKASIMLEEVGLPYEVHPINLQKGEQKTPEYLAVNPNNKIPSIIDTDGPGGRPFKLIESGAILM
jgi:GST-like protein